MIPSILVELGRAVEIQTANGDIWEFPKSGRFVLTTNPEGKGKLFIFSATSNKPISKTSEKAEKLRRSFTGKMDIKTRIVDVSEKKLIRFGVCKAVVYESDKYGRTLKEYIHDFKTAPVLNVDSIYEPRIVVISGSKIRVTERGITG